MEKLTTQYTINLSEEQAQLLEKCAEYLQRKPRELLRLLVVPEIRQLFADIQRQEHPENAKPLTVATFRERN